MEPVRIAADPEHGLSDAQAAARRAQGLFNAQPPNITKSTGLILREHICTFFNLIHIVIFAALVLVGSYRNLAFMGVVLSNLLIGIVQEVRSKRAVEKLSLLHAHTARVIRGGKELSLRRDEIVLDDILLLSLGDQVPTDCVLLTGDAELDCSLLTGEAKPLLLKPGDMLLSGSVVVAGACRARVERVGANSYAAALTMEAKKPSPIFSRLMRSLRLIIRFAGGFVLPLGLLLFLRAHAALDHSLQSAIQQAAAAMLGMIPSGLVLLTSVTLALGVVALSRKRLLVQEPYAIETLARADILCLDKTGTLTTGEMRVSGIRPFAPHTGADAEGMLYALIGAIPADNATARALHARFHHEGAPAAHSVTAFSSRRRYSAAAFDAYTLYIGAPEAVCPLSLCPKDREAARAHASEGNRVLLLARGAPVQGTPPPPDACAPAPVAYILLTDEIRPGASDTLRFFREQGVDIRLISGDAPETAAHIAHRLGLLAEISTEACVDVSALDDDALKAAAARARVFGRVSPHKKREILRALKALGHTVAMTGDGVNDLLALREADCGIALQAGSGAARQAAHMVLLTNDFTALPNAVMEGRRVVNNMKRMASLFLVKTIYSFLLTISAVLLAFPYPFQPVQLTLISMATVGLPSLILAMGPNRARITGDFLKSVLAQAIPGAICVYAFAVVAGLAGPALGLAYQEVNTLCVYLTGTAGLFVLLRACLPLVHWRAALLMCMAALFFACTIVFAGLLGIHAPAGPVMITMFAALAAACYPLLLLLTRAVKLVLHVEG